MTATTAVLGPGAGTGGARGPGRGGGQERRNGDAQEASGGGAGWGDPEGRGLWHLELGACVGEDRAEACVWEAVAEHKLSMSSCTLSQRRPCLPLQDNLVSFLFQVCLFLPKLISKGNLLS